MDWRILLATTVSGGRIQYPYTESVCDHVFQTEGVCRHFKKLKILGTECWRIVMRNYIQPRDYSRGGGTDGTLHIKFAVRMASAIRSISTATVRGGTGT